MVTFRGWVDNPFVTCGNSAIRVDSPALLPAPRPNLSASLVILCAPVGLTFESIQQRDIVAPDRCNSRSIVRCQVNSQLSKLTSNAFNVAEVE